MLGRLAISPTYSSSVPARRDRREVDGLQARAAHGDEVEGRVGDVLARDACTQSGRAAGDRLSWNLEQPFVCRSSRHLHERGIVQSEIAPRVHDEPIRAGTGRSDRPFAGCGPLHGEATHTAEAERLDARPCGDGRATRIGDGHVGNRAVGGQHERDARGHAVDGHRDRLPAGRERCSGPEHRLGVERCRHQRRCRADFRGAERKELPAGRVCDANVRRIDWAAATGTERTARPRLIRRCSAHGSSEHGNHGDSEGHDPERSSVVTCRHLLLLSGAAPLPFLASNPPKNVESPRRIRGTIDRDGVRRMSLIRIALAIATLMIAPEGHAQSLADAARKAEEATAKQDQTKADEKKTDNAPVRTGLHERRSERRATGISDVSCAREARGVCEGHVE